MSRAARRPKVPLPRFVDLHDNPHLAVLAVLEAALDVVVPALADAHPGLGELEAERLDSEIDAAMCVVDLARALAITLRDYKRALRVAKRRRQALMPF